MWGTYSIPSLTIYKWGSIILGVWSYLSHKDTLTFAQIVATAHLLDAISPVRHAGADTSVAKQAHIVTGHFCGRKHWWWCKPSQCWSRIYTRFELCHHLSCWCCRTSWCKVIRRDNDDYIVLHVSIAFSLTIDDFFKNFIGPENVTSKAV